MKAVKLKKQQN